ncbi:MAG TPA: HlyD family type I secretion periplasmic adaptor subunit [Acetobacteraceae bacterium]|nr:HlyD family type I secretion periplasmic adaptor subunit [Acetobacteraceae bacterium]
MTKNLPAVRHDDPALPVILEFQSPTTGVMATPIPPIAKRMTWVIASMFAALALAAGLIPVDQVVTARGEVVSRAPTLVVQPYDLSIVRSIDVHMGEQVHAGQVLARLDPTFAAADVSSLVAQVSSLQAQVSRLQAEADGRDFTYSGTEPDLALQAAIFAQKKAEYDYKIRNYQEKIDSLVDQIRRANSDAKGFAERLQVAKQVEAMRRDSERAYVGSKLNTLAAMDNTAEMERNMQSAEEQAQQGARDLAAQVAERDAYVQSWHADISQQLADATQKLSDARQQLNKAQLHQQLVELRADRDGTVLTVAKISVGSVVQPGQQLITLMPADAPLEVEANIAGNDDGYVRVGDPVAIKFDTFPFTRYGLAHGTIRTISANSFTAMDQQQNATPGNVPLPNNTLEPYYKARVTIDKVDLHGTPEGFHLIPGMPVTADIKVGKQTVLSYLLDRVLPITSDAMREPS